MAKHGIIWVYGNDSERDKEGLSQWALQIIMSSSAHELTKKCSSNSIEKLVSTLADAQVETKPHQIDAALFAFKSPLSKGAILADEVGLGKTIEAGIVIAQKWAEKKRRMLIIVPSTLRK